MNEAIRTIEGMTCTHCKVTVEKVLNAVPGVSSAQVDLARKQAMVVGSAEQPVMAKAVAQAGFKV